MRKRSSNRGERSILSKGRVSVRGGALRGGGIAAVRHTPFGHIDWLLPDGLWEGEEPQWILRPKELLGRLAGTKSVPPSQIDP
jgi:hypothetical protein